MRQLIKSFFGPMGILVVSLFFAGCAEESSLSSASLKELSSSDYLDSLCSYSSERVELGKQWLLGELYSIEADTRASGLRTVRMYFSSIHNNEAQGEVALVVWHLLDDPEAEVQEEALSAAKAISHSFYPFDVQELASMYAKKLLELVDSASFPIAEKSAEVLHSRWFRNLVKISDLIQQLGERSGEARARTLLALNGWEKWDRDEIVSAVLPLVDDESSFQLGETTRSVGSYAMSCLFSYEWSATHVADLKLADLLAEGNEKDKRKAIRLLALAGEHSAPYLALVVDVLRDARADENQGLAEVAGQYLVRQAWKHAITFAECTLASADTASLLEPFLTQDGMDPQLRVISELLFACISLEAYLEKIPGDRVEVAWGSIQEIATGAKGENAARLAKWIEERLKIDQQEII